MLRTGTSPHLHKVVPHKELRVHLEQINSSENVPMSTVLRTLPVKYEEYNSGRAEEFIRLKYKKTSEVNFRIQSDSLENSRQIVDVGYTSILLHLTRHV